MFEPVFLLTLIESMLLTLDKTRYNWPWENTCFQIKVKLLSVVPTQALPKEFLVTSFSQYLLNKINL